MCTKKFVFADGTVFSASNVRQDALFMEYKYAWDDVELLNLRNEVANGAKDNGKIEFVRIRRLSAQMSFLYQKQRHRVGLKRRVLGYVH